jgi:hypothetical protein
VTDAQHRRLIYSPQVSLRKGRHAIGVAAALLWLLVPAGVAGSAGFAAPQQLGGPGAADGDTAVDAFGTALSVWVQRSAPFEAGPLWASWRPPGGTFGEPVLLGQAGWVRRR